MNLLREIPAGKNPPELINVIVDIPKGSLNKYEYNEQKECFCLDRVLYSPMIFPFDYGSIPQTKAEDGDPLDVILLTSYPTFPGCLVQARPLGILFMEDESGEDNKILAAPIEKIDPRFKEIRDISDLPEHTRKEIESFFEHYKKLEPGKFVKIKEWGSKEKAEQEILAGIRNFQRENEQGS